MSVASDFETFCGNLTINNAVSIGDRYKAITKRLNLDFYKTDSETYHSFYTGSYGRGTATRNFSDLDMIFVLPYSVYEKYNKYASNGQSALLQEVRTSIARTYSTTSIRADGQVVQVPFTDGMTFEVVPAFINTDNSYTYPDSNNNGNWKKTDPKPEIEAIRTQNLKFNYNLVSLCRMARAWKIVWNVPIGGLLIDTLANNFLTDYQYNKEGYSFYDWMVRDFFLYLSNQDSKQQYWLAIGSYQYAYRQGDFEYKAKRCYNIACEAIEHYRKSEHWTAKSKFREIFGTTFPS